MTSSRVSASGEPSRLQKLRHYTPTILVAVGVLVGWELLVRVFNIQKFLLPAPSVILNAMLNEIRLATTPGEGSILFQATLATLWSAFGGMCLGCGLGLAVALITARWTIISEAAMPFAIAANSVPIIALSPIMFNWFGPTNPLSWMMIVAVMVFFPVLINTVRGLTEIKPEALELMHSYAASDLKILFSLRVPNALPFLFSALRVASVLSMIGAIVADFFGAERNTVGKYVTQEAASLRFDNTWAAVLIASLIGITFYAVVVWAERWVTPWSEMSSKQ